MAKRDEIILDQTACGGKLSTDNFTSSQVVLHGRRHFRGKCLVAGVEVEVERQGNLYPNER